MNRNAKCPFCQSGKKFKHCCQKKLREPTQYEAAKAALVECIAEQPELAPANRQANTATLNAVQQVMKKAMPNRYATKLSMRKES